MDRNGFLREWNTFSAFCAVARLMAHLRDGEQSELLAQFQVKSLSYGVLLVSLN